MRLARLAAAPASTAGQWAVRDLPGIYLYRFRNSWRIWGFPVEDGLAVVERLWPERVRRGDISDGRDWLALRPHLRRSFPTLRAALIALEKESSQDGALGEMLCS